MKLEKSTIYIALGTLIIGLILGSILFGGKEANSEMSESISTVEEHDHSGEEIWTCSMHPQVRQADPGSCPFCGMDLIPVAEENENPRVLKMSNAALKLANIQTSIVGKGIAKSKITLNGRIKANEGLIQTQTTHFPGRIEKLYKNFEGQEVKIGDKVASIYSPELLAAQNELLEAKKLSDTNPALLEAARNKLKYWKLTHDQIHQIEGSGEAMRNIDLLSNYKGIITNKMANNGTHLMEGQALYELSDLSEVWAVFEVYEKDLGLIKLGDKIEFKTNGTNKTFQAKVNFISPNVDANKRVIEIRADVGNSSGQLKPGMFIEADLTNEQNSELIIPKSAILWTGERSVAYVKLPNNEGFELREVKLGRSFGDNYEVLEGLEKREEIVTNGAFTLDAEAQLKGKISMMNPSENNKNTNDVGFTEVELSTPLELGTSTSSLFKEQLNFLLSEYIVLKDAMVEGQSQSIRQASIKTAQTLDQVDMTLLEGEAHMHWMELLETMNNSLGVIKSSNDRELQRLQFINLSKAVINSLNSFGIISNQTLYVQFCPMANNDKGATWVSLEEEIINPYFGDMMLHCGNVEYTIEYN